MKASQYIKTLTSEQNDEFEMALIMDLWNLKKKKDLQYRDSHSEEYMVRPMVCL